jgi:hypothetical protein
MRTCSVTLGLHLRHASRLPTGCPWHGTQSHASFQAMVAELLGMDFNRVDLTNRPGVSVATESVQLFPELPEPCNRESQQGVKALLLLYADQARLSGYRSQRKAG